MQLHPSHHADDIGAMLGSPSSFSVEINATAVPKYRMVGSIVLCMRPQYESGRSEDYPIFVPKFPLNGRRTWVSTSTQETL